MRHTPREPNLRRVLPLLAAEKSKLFDCYQQFQQPRVEKQLASADYLVSFIGDKQREAIFVGVYSVRGSSPVSRNAFWRIPENAALREFAMIGWRQTDRRKYRPRFDLKPTQVYAEWKGKLVIDWPGREISWVRWLDKNEFKVKAILKDSVLDQQMEDWDKLVLTWQQLRNLPRRLVDRLKEWRGVYFIHDGKDGKGYVGSACGPDNIYGRWMNYAARSDGGNKLLRKRDPGKFRFSILQRFYADAEPEAVLSPTGRPAFIHASVDSA